MNKKYFFFLLMFSILIGTIYSFIYTYTFFNLKNFLTYTYIDNKNTLSFFKEKSKIVHHLREPNRKRKSDDEYIFSYIARNDLKETVLFQGDSWMQGINDHPEANSYLKSRFNNDYNLINAGTMSYSPSLMSVQYDLLKNNFNIKPDYMIVYIDQTDVGDEVCRYRYLKKFNKENKLIAVPYEEYPYYTGLSIDLVLKHSEIALSNKSAFLKTQNFINYKIKKLFYKNIKTYKKKVLKKNFSGKCSSGGVHDVLVRNDKSEIEYFKYALLEYLNKLDNDKNLKKIFIITHPHKFQQVEKKTILNVSSIVEEAIYKKPKFEHINFTKKIAENEKLYKNYNNIWENDMVHLKVEPLITPFLEEITDTFFLLINKTN